MTKAAKTCPTKVYRRIIPSRTTELGKSLPVCGTIVHYPRTHQTNIASTEAIDTVHKSKLIFPNTKTVLGAEKIRHNRYTTIVFLLISAIVRYPAHYSTCPIPSSSKKDSKRKVKAYRSEPIGAPGHIIKNKIVKYRLSYRPGNLRKRPLFFIFVRMECVFNTFGSKYITFGHFITFRI